MFQSGHKHVQESVGSEDKLPDTLRKRMDRAGRKPSSDVIDDEIPQLVWQLYVEQE